MDVISTSLTQDTQPYVNQADAEPETPWAALRRSLMSAIRRRPALTKPPLPSRRRSHQAVKPVSAHVEEVVGTSSDAAAMSSLSLTPMVATLAAQHSGVLGGSQARQAEPPSPASSSHPQRQTNFAAASANSPANGGLYETGAVRAALQALSPFVPQLLCKELAATVPLLPSLAGLAEVQHPDMASVAKVTCWPGFAQPTCQNIGIMQPDQHALRRYAFCVDTPACLTHRHCNPNIRSEGRYQIKLLDRMQCKPLQALVPAITSFEGAVLVADIGGFTALTEQLSRAESGVELLTKCINDYFARVSP